MLDVTDWNSNPETFNFIRHEWDIAAAKDILRNNRREVVELGLEGVFELLQLPPESKQLRMGVTVHWSVVDECGELFDLTVLIILVPFQDSYLPIDGWHRIAKAQRKGIDTLPCVVLTAEEASKIKLS